ncbi:hypothetical protein ACF073_08780 [Streptomyces sp. NPDC015171]|uniref:hypothetical protein n=1 Tax=Streptomyces sp. NPDC015171 TaxID=3364945 RepID=UPI0036F72EC7
MNAVRFLVAAGSAPVPALGGPAGTGGLVALGAGTLLPDVGMRPGTVAARARVHAVGASVRGRLDTARMTCAYPGGGAGPRLGVRVCARCGRAGVRALVGVLAAPGPAGRPRGPAGWPPRLPAGWFPRRRPRDACTKTVRRPRSDVTVR